MKKRGVVMGVALALWIVVTAGFAYGQGHTVVANIPFEFVAGGQVLPAGEYRVQTQSLGDGRVE